MRRLPSTMQPLSKLSAVILSILIFSTLSLAAVADRISGPIVPGQFIKVSAGVPRKAQPQFDQGAVDPGLKLSYMTLLTVPSASQRKAINQLLAQQQDPRSALYHKWLTPEQYAERFGLSQNDVNKIVAWLQSQGFTVHNVARSRNDFVFSGTVAQVENAFQPRLHNFNIDGEKHFANTTPPSIPAALSGIVTDAVPGKAVVATRQDSHAALLQIAHGQRALFHLAAHAHAGGIGLPSRAIRPRAIFKRDGSS